MNIIDRKKLLLDKLQRVVDDTNGATMDERASALARMEEIRQKYDLEEYQTQIDNGIEIEYNIIHRKFLINGSFKAQQRLLFWACTTLIGTEAIHFNGSEQYMVVYGTETDIDITISVFKMLHKAMLLDKEEAELEGRRENTEFVKGWVYTLRRRASDITKLRQYDYEQAVNTSEVTAITIVTNKNELAKVEVERNHPTAKPDKYTFRIKDKTAFEMGQEAGAKTKLQEELC